MTKPDPISETFCSLEHRTMDNVEKPSNPVELKRLSYQINNFIIQEQFILARIRIKWEKFVDIW
jgi:hypothetical protein